jgi:hypothetical protein
MTSMVDLVQQSLMTAKATYAADAQWMLARELSASSRVVVPQRPEIMEHRLTVQLACTWQR